MTISLDAESPVYDLATSFSRSLKGQRRSPNTIEVYLRSIHDFDRYASANGIPRDPAKIKRTHVEAYLEDQLERNKPATAATRYASLSRFFTWLVEEGEILTSPMARMKPPQVPDRPPMVLTSAEIDAILAASDGPTFRQRRDRALLSFMADTGCRRTEVSKLKLTDVDAERQVATVIGKGDKQREVVYSTRTAVALDRYLRVRQKHSKAFSPMLWLGQFGPLSGEGIAEVVARRGTRAGVFREVDGQKRALNPHLFRHAFADRWLASGGNETDLMTLGGWSSAEVMRRYGRGRRTERAIDAARRHFGEPA